MNSRDRILAAVKGSQPEVVVLPEVEIPQPFENLVERYISVATAIGAKVFELSDFDGLKSIIAENFGAAGRKISSFTELSQVSEQIDTSADPHSYEDVEVAILKADLAVSENGALWVPESNSIQRVLPFIAQHLVLIVDKQKLVPSMHQAYEIIGDAVYGYSAFIAGPSKTADIEQSLVLGAHGPRSLTVVLMG